MTWTAEDERLLRYGAGEPPCEPPTGGAPHDWHENNTCVKCERRRIMCNGRYEYTLPTWAAIRRAREGR